MVVVRIGSQGSFHLNARAVVCDDSNSSTSVWATVAALMAFAVEGAKACDGWCNVERRSIVLGG
jgi:hypothetical protein